MKIDLEEIYQQAVDELRGWAPQGLIQQEFLFMLQERGEEFLATKN